MLSSGKMTTKQVEKVLNGLGYDVDFTDVSQSFNNEALDGIREGGQDAIDTLKE